VRADGLRVACGSLGQGASLPPFRLTWIRVILHGHSFDQECYWVPSINVECKPVQDGKAHDWLVSREGISNQNVSQCSIPGTWGFRPWGFHSSEPYKEASEWLITGYPGPDPPEGGHLWKAFKPIDHRRRWALGKGIVKVLLQKQLACSAFYLGSNSL
jgi:hypothetical protein